MQKMTAGIIGCGIFGEYHTRILTHFGLIVPHAYVDFKLDAAARLLTMYGGAYCDSSYMRILEDPEIDIVFICTTHDMHHPIALAAIEHGKHVFMEKPMCMKVEQCDEILKALHVNPVKFAVGHKMRFAPNVQKAKKAIPHPITIIAQMMCGRWPDDMWAQDPIKGGGNVLSQGCHIFDLVTYLAGDEPERIYAEGGAITHPGLKQLDNIVATIRFKNGVMASVTIGDAGLNGFTSKTMVQIYGGDSCVNISERLLRYDRFTGLDVEHSEIPDDFMDPLHDPEGLYLQAKVFYNYIVNNSLPVVGAKEGANAVKMVHAAFRSAREGTAQMM